MTLIDETNTSNPSEREEELKHTGLMNRYDVIIIGGGVAGLSAGLYAARDGFSTLIIEGDFISSTEMPGGALLLTPEIENFPGFVRGEGTELVSIIRSQAEHFGADIRIGRVAEVNLATTNCGLHTITTADGNAYVGKSVILATGAVARQLGVEGEIEFIGRGVSTCATCDGFFFESKKVAVVGGGDTAVEDALFLRRYASEVTMIVRGNTFRATGPDAREALELSEQPDSNFRIIWESEVKAIHNDGANVTGVTYVNHDLEFTLELDGVFVAIGRDPSTQFLVGSEVLLDGEGYIITETNSSKVSGNTHGVFAAGDVVDKKFRQAITSAGRAVEAALEAREYLLTAKRS